MEERARHTRNARIDTRIDTDTGEFDMVLATEGEASDGHVISIRGLTMPETMPLQLDHSQSALANLGTVSHMRRDKLDGIPVYRGVGKIRLSGEGEAVDARRDLVDAISTGHVRGVSLTWDAVKVVERRELPKAHAAYVGRNEADTRKRFGLFFEKSVGIEQSVVGIPADREALIGRGVEATCALSRSMWDDFVSRIDVGEPSREVVIINALERSMEALEQRCRDAEATAPSDDALERNLSVRGSTSTDQLRDALGEAHLRVTGGELSWKRTNPLPTPEARKS